MRGYLTLIYWPNYFLIMSHLVLRTWWRPKSGWNERRDAGREKKRAWDCQKKEAPVPAASGGRRVGGCFYGTWVTWPPVTLNVLLPPLCAYFFFSPHHVLPSLCLRSIPLLLLFPRVQTDISWTDLRHQTITHSHTFSHTHKHTLPPPPHTHTNKAAPTVSYTQKNVSNTLSYDVWWKEFLLWWTENNLTSQKYKKRNMCIYWTYAWFDRTESTSVSEFSTIKLHECVF